MSEIRCWMEREGRSTSPIHEGVLRFERGRSGGTGKTEGRWEGGSEWMRSRGNGRGIGRLGEGIG